MTRRRRLRKKVRVAFSSYAKAMEEKHGKALFKSGRIAYEEYLKLMATDVKWGITLMGMGRGYKCMRETEFMSLGLPMAYSYIPFYDFDFEPNVHYFHLKSPEYLEQLFDSERAKYYAEQSRLTWENHICPDAYIQKILDKIDSIST